MTQDAIMNVRENQIRLIAALAAPELECSFSFDKYPPIFFTEKQFAHL
jgi:hypothetical protein